MLMVGESGVYTQKRLDYASNCDFATVKGSGGSSEKRLSVSGHPVQ
jgi:hypothetical protein